MRKILIGFVLLMVVLLLIPVGLILTSNLWLGSALASGIKGVTGFPTKIEKTHLDLGRSQFGLYGIRIKNPRGFPDVVFASIPELYVDFDLSQFLKSRKLYFQEIRLSIEEVMIIRNQSGQTNLAQLKAVSKPKMEMAKERKEIEKARSPEALGFFVEKLVLTIRRVHYRDEARALIGERTIDVHINNQVFTGIANPMDIVRIVVLQITYKAALGNLGVPVDMLKGHLDESLAVGQKLALQSTALARQMGTQTLGEGKRLVEQAAQNIPVSSAEVEKTAEQVSSKAKSIFGSAGSLLKKTSQSIQEKAESVTTSRS